MMVTSVRGPAPFPGSVTFRLWSTNVTTLIPTANGGCGGGTGRATRGAVCAAVATVVADVDTCAVLVAGFELPPQAASASTARTAANGTPRRTMRRLRIRTLASEW